MNDLVKPFKALRVQGEMSQQVSSPPYDVPSYKKALAFADGNPLSFLRVTRSEIEFDEGTSENSTEVFKRSADNLKKLIEGKILYEEKKPGYYLYTITRDDFELRGLIAVFSTKAYRENRIVRHELIRPDKEKNRADHLDNLGVQPSPVLLAVPGAKELSQTLYNHSLTKDDVSAHDEDGYLHRLTFIADEKEVSAITKQCNDLPLVYIADGHHRSSAASSVKDCEYFLAGLFMAEDTIIHGYHRGIVAGTSIDSSLISTVKKQCQLTKIDAIIEPPSGSCLFLYKEESYLLKFRESTDSNPVSRLDSFRLNDQVLAPIFNIKNLRTDKRICFVGGVTAERLRTMVKTGEIEVGFYMPATKMAELIAVAGAGELMPPKSTWFVPKLLDGLVSYRFR